MSKLLLRRGWQWEGGKKNWSQAHWHWLKSLRFEHRPDQWMFEDYLLAIEQIATRLKALEAQMESSPSWPSYTMSCALTLREG